jgi:hypothetical protein
VDYVADAVFELFERPMEGEEPGTFHLVAGPRASTVGRLIDLSADYFARRRPRALAPALYRHVVHRLLLSRSEGKRRRALERSELYFPYFSMRVRYDDRRARRLLDPAGITPTPLEGYFTRLADFAVRSDWGRRAVSREKAYRARG